MSDARYERDNLRFLTVKTPNLKGRGDIFVFVPNGIPATGPLPVVILLHGVYGSAWSWPFSSGVHIKAYELMKAGQLPPMVIAMPSDGLWGDGSGYLAHNGYNFEKWIAEDVPAAVRENIPGVTPQSAWFIAGLSMGGFGALRIGAKYWQQFKGISGLSSITAMPQMKLFAEEALINYAQADVTDECVFETIKKYRYTLPALRFDCGTDDLLISHNRQLHRKLEKEGILHTYLEFPGGHEWTYWAKHIIGTLQFFAGLV